MQQKNSLGAFLLAVALISGSFAAVLLTNSKAYTQVDSEVGGPGWTRLNSKPKVRLGGMNLANYCQRKYGSSKHTLVANNVYGWRCIANGQKLGINASEVCAWQYRPGSVPRYDVYNNAYTWYCYNR